MAVNLSRLGCGPTWHVYGARERWTDFRDEVRDIRGLPMDMILERVECELKEEEKLVLAEWTGNPEYQKHTLEMCEQAAKQQIPFVLQVLTGDTQREKCETLLKSKGVEIMNVDSVTCLTNWRNLKENCDVTICALADCVDDTVIVESSAYVKL
eukprot:5399190-Amphidinium_carterae.1